MIDRVEKFRSILLEEVEQLLDYTLELMQEEIAEGWRTFYAREIWFQENLMPPLINALGRQAMKQRLCAAIQGVRGAVVAEGSPLPEASVEYRCYLDVGVLDIEVGDTPNVVLDHTANMVANSFMEKQHRHFRFEVWANEQNWFVQAGKLATLTSVPPTMRRQREIPVRLAGVQLSEDGMYWRALHHLEWSILREAFDYQTLCQPDGCMVLMRVIGPDFIYSPVLSTVNRLVFLQEGDGDFSWALMFDREKLHVAYDAPELVLVNRRHSGKLCDVDILFRNVIGKRFLHNANCMRDLETELLFYVARSRRLTSFYAPFLARCV